MAKYECYKIVFSSSATVYGENHKKKNFNEYDLKYPVNTYGDTKYTIEKILFLLILIIKIIQE